MKFLARAAAISGLSLMAGALVMLAVNPPATREARLGAADFLLASVWLTIAGAAGSIASELRS
jgi:hypothetical protein